MHNIEQHEDQAAFVTRGEPAWHRLGTVMPADEDLTTADALRIAHLANWNVRVVEFDALVDGMRLDVPNKRLSIRDNPFTPGQVDVLGVVGGRFTPFQNEQAFAFADNLIDANVPWETAGSLDEGRRVFGSFILPREIVIDEEGANDVVKNYLVVSNGHDGSQAVEAMITPTRVVCQNTLRIARRDAKSSWKVRHTASVEGRVAEAQQALKISYAYLDKFEEEAKMLYQTAMTSAQFFDIVTDLYPAPDEDKKGANTRWEKKVDLLGDLFLNSPTQANIAGTAWAGLNAMTERLDWYRKPRGGDGTTVLEAASGFSDVIQAEKSRIRSRVLEFANA